jgi:diguanylate cyclase (GGDEF)-like protein/PAS domain S-box-containing protein
MTCPDRGGVVVAPGVVYGSGFRYYRRVSTNLPDQKPDLPLQAILDASPSPIVEVDGEGHIRRANRACTTLLGYGPAELLGRVVEELVPQEHRLAHARHRKYFAADGVARPMGDGRPIHVLRADGSRVEVQVTLSPQATGVLVAMVDLTDRRRLEEDLKLRTHQMELAQRQLAEVALIDPVTGARNRAAFFEDLGARLALSMRGGHPLSLVVLDVDGFQAVNRALGEAAGDELLRKLASILRYTSRRSDLVARTGADVFTVLLPETDSGGGSFCADRIRSAVSEAVWPHGPVTASLGVETFVPDGSGPQDQSVDRLSRALLDRAREALQRAKDDGRDRVVHAQDLSPGEEDST